MMNKDIFVKLLQERRYKSVKDVLDVMNAVDIASLLGEFDDKELALAFRLIPKEKAAEKIKEMGIVPVVVLEDAMDAKPLAKALCEGGLPCAEVTFRTAAAKESIRIMLEEYPEMFVGAGTVLTTRQVDEAIEAGAKFIVSPGLDPEIVDYCIEKQIPVFPGCVTASELAQAVKRGLEVVKFFPAETSGGLAAIKALAAPYVGMKFMPTGGINPGNVRTYLESDVILACGGSWMVKKDLIQSGQFDAIRQMTADAVALVKEVRGSQEK